MHCRITHTEARARGASFLAGLPFNLFMRALHTVPTDRLPSARSLAAVAGSAPWVIAGLSAAALAAIGLLRVDPEAVTALKLLLLAPVLEEVVLRGGLHEPLRRRSDFWGRPAVAVGLTAVAFGLAHLWLAPWTHALAVMVPALAIGVVFERTRSIFACVMVHAAFNAMWWIWSSWR